MKKNFEQEINIIILDFETVNKGDACEVGALKIVNGEIVDSFQSLIKPHSPSKDWSKFAMNLHKIKEIDLKDKPSFLEVFKVGSKIFSWINNPENIVVTHNTNFDIVQVLKPSLLKFPIEYKFKYICSYKMLELRLGKKPKGSEYYKLENLAKKHKISYTKHRSFHCSTTLHKIIKKEFGSYFEFLSFVRDQKDGIKTFEN